MKLSEEVDVEADVFYPITCGDSKATLVWKKFVCPGINVKCVQVHALYFDSAESIKITILNTRSHRQYLNCLFLFNQFNEQLISPKEFVCFSGKSTLKDWKRAIRLNGTMLRSGLVQGNFDIIRVFFQQHLCFLMIMVYRN